MPATEKAKRINQMTITQWEAAFPDETACAAYVVAHRWPWEVCCPRCGNLDVKPHGTMPFNWLCNECSPSETNYRFSHITGTVFENTNKPLRDWFRVIHMMVTAKKGVSALQVMRTMGFGSYKTAWYMCHRIRVAMRDREFHQLMGIVEVDETAVGGKAANRHKDKRGGGKGHKGPKKSVVVGAIARSKKSIVARVVDGVTLDSINTFIRETVSNKMSLLATDQWPGYKSLNEYARVSVDHSTGQYVVGAIHTNTIEGFWSLLKRGIMGNFHKVSPKYLPLYVAEACFKYNNRENEDIFGSAVRGC